MDTSTPVDNAHKSKDSASENNAISCQDEELMQFEVNDEEEEDDDDGGEDSEDEDSDNEKYEEDLLLALGEGYSEERNDLPDTSNQANATPSKINLPFLKKSQDNSLCLPADLDILNLNTQLSKWAVPGIPDNTNTNASTCLFLNNIYQTLLMENLTKLRQKLAENQEKQKVLHEKIKQSLKNDANKQRKNVFCIPYFHRKGKMPEPNEHTKILQTWHYDKIDREKQWTNKDHELLIDAIHENAWEMTLKPFLQRIEICSVKMAATDDEKETDEFEQKIEDIELELEIAQQQDINEIIMKIDDEKFDWMKISNLTFNGKHSDFSCHLMWKNWLHPRLNKSPWTQTETMKLKELVDLHGCNQWKLVAEELGTNRTPFHCLQHYRRKLDAQVRREWTEEEDKILKEVIETCRIGDSIPWNQVSFYMEERSADACSKRWSFLNPAIKHGRWTIEEDSLLLTGVNVLGTTNWHRLKHLVPGRTIAQCRERYINCLDPCIKAEAFTYDEDKLLLKFVKKHGFNWATVSSMLPGRTDYACRRQYDKLKKWETQSQYVSKQSDESKTFFIHKFDVKHFADLVEANKTLDDFFPLLPPENNIETIWKNQQQILKRDLVRQELDRRKGEIFVPRPQLLRKYANNSLIKLWEHRKKIRQSIEEFIQKQMVKTKDKSPRKRKGYTLISPKLNNLNPNTSVTEMLKIARCITNQPVPEKVSNKKHLCSDVDKRIKNLLYLDWLKEDMKDQPKFTSNKSKANCEEEKYLDKLEGMTLIMTALGMDRKNITNKVLCGSGSGSLQSTSYLTAEELQNFKEEFLLISQDPLYNGNFSGEKTPMVEYADNVPPNIYTLSAFRLLILERQNLQKSADCFPNFQRKTNTDPDGLCSNLNPLTEKMEKVKQSYWYKMLRVHFRSLFMWPALLSTLSEVQQKLVTPKPCANTKRKKNKYPLISRQQKFRKKRKIHHQTDGACPSSNNQIDQIPKPSEESNSSEVTTTATVAQAHEKQIPQKRGKGRPVGSVTKHKKVYDTVPQRTSSRQREKKARLDSELSASQEAETTSKQTLNKEMPSSSTNSQEPQTSEVGNEASAKTKDLLANVSPNLVHQVISQKVQVKPVGTYITVPLTVKSSDMPMWN